jgi:hypothetical protein
MKFLIICILSAINLVVNAQTIMTSNQRKIEREKTKFFTVNPFSMAEPQFAFGVGFGNRVTKRSGYFTEVSYVAKTPFYGAKLVSLNGYRLIAQYRYYLLREDRRSYFLHKRKQRMKGFIGVELRLKQYNFSDTTSYSFNISRPGLNSTPVYGYLYKANAFKMAGAIIVGEEIEISDRLKIDFTMGIGLGHKQVKFNNIPDGYETIINERKFDWGIPKIYENHLQPTFIYALRLKYMF